MCAIIISSALKKLSTPLPRVYNHHRYRLPSEDRNTVYAATSKKKKKKKDLGGVNFVYEKYPPHWSY